MPNQTLLPRFRVSKESIMDIKLGGVSFLLIVGPQGKVSLFLASLSSQHLVNQVDNPLSLIRVILRQQIYDVVQQLWVLLYQNLAEFIIEELFLIGPLSCPHMFAASFLRPF